MNERRYLLIKLAEEATEISQAVLIATQYGDSNIHDKESKENFALLHGELNDLLAVINVLNERHDFAYTPNNVFIEHNKEILKCNSHSLQYLLLKLAGEVSQLSQRTLKAIQFGLLEVYQAQNKTNLALMHEHIDITMAMLDLLNTQYDFRYKRDNEAIHRKIEKLHHFFSYILTQCHSE